MQQSTITALTAACRTKCAACALLACAYGAFLVLSHAMNIYAI